MGWRYFFDWNVKRQWYWNCLHLSWRRKPFLHISFFILFFSSFFSSALLIFKTFFLGFLIFVFLNSNKKLFFKKWLWKGRISIISYTIGWNFIFLILYVVKPYCSVWIVDCSLFRKKPRLKKVGWIKTWTQSRLFFYFF